MGQLIPTGKRMRIQDHLMQWFRSASRRLAWRDDPSDYKIWISEIMAQQTRIRVMQPYYDRFLEKYPNVQKLAQASLDEVLASWSGLGYYRRAESLHKAARIIVSEFNGKLPSDPDQLKQLPGIGPYTAGAIASIAFGKRVAVLDGNVIRVISRLFGVDLDVSTQAARKHLLSIADELLLESNPGDFNQALMELGALVCLAKSPDCCPCPLKEFCFSLKTNSTGLRPVKTKRLHAPVVRLLCALLKSPDGMWLLVQNPPGGLFGGLWQLPAFRCKKLRTMSAEKDTLTRSLSNSLGMHVSVGDRIIDLEHKLTHMCLDVGLYGCSCDSKHLVSMAMSFRVDLVRNV